MTTEDTVSGAKGVILDRDGTLIDVVRDEETGAISTAFHPSQIRLLSGVIEGLKMLTDAGYSLSIATNQPGPAKGHFSIDAVRRTNDALVSHLRESGIAIDRVEVCMHHPDGGPTGDRSLVGPCECRKPRAGMLDTIARELRLARSRSWMVGDSAGDVEAGRAAGMRTALLFASNRCELCPLRAGVGAIGSRATPTVHGATMVAIAKAILAAPETGSSP